MEHRILAKIEPGTRIAAIVGPTAVGKTAAAMKISEKLDAEIVSMDAMQVYRGMDIGTGKPSRAELKSVPFHMLDVALPTQNFSVAHFKELADDTVFEIASRGKQPLLVGGSGLYYRAVVDDLDFANVGGADRYRVEVAEELDGMDDLELHDLLDDLDPAAAGEIPASNRRRVLRAIEVARQGDRLMSERQHAWSDYDSPYELAVAGLEMHRHALYKLIDLRVDAMMASGLEDEVRRLSAGGLKRGATAGEALGYRQLLEYLDGDKTLDEAVDEIKRRTRNFAKRQLTWFRSDPRVKWFEVRVDRDNPARGLESELERVAGEILEYFAANLEN
ncbi:MAG: tRNA (adenosine(37)-N6)-dimethylallyltransferase MiaA [Candidatus Geothermincolia bacterium]